MKRTKKAALMAVLATALLSACATEGTRVTTTSDTYKSMANSQQGWCSQFGCGCQLDGKPATCSLVQTCITTGSCQAAK